MVLSGSNGFFSAGADLAWMKDGMKQTDEENRADAQLFNNLYHEMSLYPKPIIAKVEKGAYGGAIGLMACADVVITSNNAQFKFSETALELSCNCSSIHRVRLVIAMPLFIVIW